MLVETLIKCLNEEIGYLERTYTNGPCRDIADSHRRLVKRLLTHDDGRRTTIRKTPAGDYRISLYIHNQRASTCFEATLEDAKDTAAAMIRDHRN